MATRTTKIQLIADDKASKKIKKVGTAAQRASLKLKTAGKAMRGFGKSASLYLTAPIAAFGFVASKAFFKQEKAIANVAAGLEQTGGRVGFTLDQMKAKASEFQSVGIFGDEDILGSVTAQLLTFGEITGDVFNRAQQAVLDITAKLGEKGDLHSSAIMLGKALDSPAEGLSAMSRAGIKFSDETENMVKAMVEANDVAGAQAIILADIERLYGGTNEAMAATSAGGMTQMKNRMGDLSEQFGAVIVQIGEKLIPKLESLMGWFEGLNDKQRNMLVIVGLIIAAIPPLVWSLGTVATAIHGINVALGLMMGNPIVLFFVAIGIVIAATVALIILNWDRVKKRMAAAWYHIGEAWDFVWDKVSGGINNLKNLFGDLKDVILESFKTAFNYISDAWNNTVGSLSWSVPGWVPIIGGNTLSVPNIPKFYTGTENFQGGMAMVGEHGAEMVSLPPGAKVKTATETNAALAHGSMPGQKITFNIFNQMDLDYAAQYLSQMVARG